MKAKLASRLGTGEVLGGVVDAAVVVNSKRPATAKSSDLMMNRSDNNFLIL